MKTTGTTRGGSRPGAGRKPGSGIYGEPSKPIRIPLGLIEKVLKLITEYMKQKGEKNGKVNQG